jgi:hypothetical protein
MSPAARKKVAGDRHTNDACRSKAARQKKLDSKKMMEAENIQLKEENEKLKKENSKLKIRIKDWVTMQGFWCKAGEFVSSLAARPLYHYRKDMQRDHKDAAKEWNWAVIRQEVKRERASCD